MGAPSILRASAGPLAFVAASVVGGRRIPGYSPLDEPISAIASRGSEGAGLMIPGFVALGLGTLDLAWNLPDDERTPASVRRMLLGAGITTIGAGLARCSARSCPTRFFGDLDAEASDEIHGSFSMATFLLWIAMPLVSAHAASADDPLYARRARLVSAATFVAWAATGTLVARRSTRWRGLAQRLMAASAFTWFPLVAS